MHGYLKIRVRKQQKKEASLLIAEGKVCVIGFESVLGSTYRHTFYQRASPISAIASGYGRICNSLPDAEGFSLAAEGVHNLPFAMHLPIGHGLGNAKGSPGLHSSVALRYIIMM